MENELQPQLFNIINIIKRRIPNMYIQLVKVNTKFDVAICNKHQK